MADAQGSCLCGDIGIAVTWPSKWVAHCHCSLCRRAHGAAFVTWIGMDAGQCDIDDPQAQLRWYASSPGAERGFCARCGCTLFFRSQRWPGEMHIVLANLHGDADRAPMVHAYWEERVPWIALDTHDGLQRIGDPQPK